MKSKAMTSDTGTTDNDDSWRSEGRNLAALLLVVWRAMNVEFHRRMDAAGFEDVRPGSGNVFSYVGPNGSSIAAMAQRAHVSPQAMVQTVDELQAKGYVERVPSTRDRRVKLVCKTAKGEAMTRLAGEILADIEAGYAATLGRRRFDLLRQALEDLRDSLERQPGA